MKRIPLIVNPSFVPRFKYVLKKNVNCIGFYKHYIISFFESYFILWDTKTFRFYPVKLGKDVDAIETFVVVDDDNLKTLINTNIKDKTFLVKFKEETLKEYSKNYAMDDGRIYVENGNLYILWEKGMNFLGKGQDEFQWIKGQIPSSYR